MKKQRMAQNENMIAQNRRDAIIIYFVSARKVTQHPDNLDEWQRHRLFTSKSKAVDACRRFAEECPKIVERYKEYADGKKSTYSDLYIDLITYTEHEGVMLLTDLNTYMEVLDGELNDYSGFKYFETF